MTRLLILSLSCVCLIVGCTSSSEEAESKASKYQAADSTSTKTASDNTELPGPASLVDATPQANSIMGNPAAAPSIDGILGEPQPVPSGLAPLANDAPLEATLAYFEKTNDALRKLMSGQSAFTTQDAQIAEAKRISQQKLDAADHAIGIKDIQPASLTVAKRTKLEALSQLAGLQDVAAAKQLEDYASELATSDDPELVNESRVVRLGFELDKIRTGQTETTDQLLKLAAQFDSSERELGMPAFFALQQCFSVLSQYGYDADARTIRDSIAAKFANHSDAQVAASAKMMAAASRFDALDELHSSSIAGEVVAPEQWQTAITELVSQPIDVATFQYLAGLALSAENAGDQDLSKLVTDAIRQTFVDAETSDPEITAEAKAFLEASINRSAAIGNPLSISYPDLAGAAIDWESFRGSLVIMPFWATSRPGSMQIIPAIQELQQALGEKVKILAVNLDESDEELAIFRQRYRLPFPTVRNPDASTRGIADPLAKQLGIASFPFAVVVDAEGNVAKILMGQQDDLQATITEILDRVN